MSSIKKIRQEKKAWFDSRSYKVGIKRAIRRKKLHNMKAVDSFYKRSSHVILDNNIISDIDEQRIEFKVPDFFSIETNGKETLIFFSKIFEYITTSIEKNKEIFINSSNVQHVSESTLMYLFAIISDIKSRDFVIAGNHPVKVEIRAKYKKCGFDKVIRTKSVLTKMIFDDGQQMLIRGNRIQTKIAAEVCNFVTKYAHIDVKDLYSALVELMGNTVQHAYNEDYYLEKKWQIFVKNELEGVKLIFLDTGKGIPGTVKKNKIERLLQVFSAVINLEECKILESAFKGEFRTQTGALNRGKGLPQIDKFLKSKNVLNAAVYSGKGMCTIQSGDNGIFSDREKEIYGTLYECVILRSVQND